MAAICYWYPLLLALVLSASGTEPQCVSTESGGHCTLSSAPQRLMLLGDRLFVGAIDSLHSFSLDLTPLDSADISPSASRRRRCVDVEAHQPQLCRNFLRVVLAVNESTILACGTNAFFPKCRFHQLDNLSDWQFMTAETQRDIGFSPHSNNTNVALLTDSGRFFTATAFYFRQQQIIGMSLLLSTDGEAAVTVQTPSSLRQWINEPVFVSAYDVGPHVYFFAREPAYEADEAEYSRAIRVCKNDSGFELYPGDSTHTFQTFQKARLRCRAAGEDGSIPYDYDGLQATYLLRPADGGEPVLYGTFSSPVNGPQGAALCKFTFNDIDSVFEDGQYRVRISASVGWKLRTTNVSSCPGQPGPQRTEEQARDFQLVYNIAAATEPQPMYSVIGDEFTHLEVDVTEYDGSQLEVVLLGQRSGVITQLVQFRGVMYRKVIKSVSGGITNILLHKDMQNEERLALFTTATSVLSFSLGRCRTHNTCFSCHDSRDPYCAWDQGNEECVNKLATDSFPTSLSDSLTSSESSIVSVCGRRPPAPTSPQPTVDPPSCPNTPTAGTADTPTTGPTTATGTTTAATTDSDGPTDTTPSLGTPAGLDTETRSENENGGQIAGAGVGGFLFGIPVGLVVCYLFFSIFLKKSHKSQEEPVLENTRTLQVNHHNHLAMFEKQPNGTRFPEPRVVHRNPTSAKNVNQDDPARGEEEDVLMELPFSKGRVPQSNQEPATQGRAVPDHPMPHGTSR